MYEGKVVAFWPLRAVKRDQTPRFDRREHSELASFSLAEKARGKENEKMGFKACTVRRYFFIWRS